MDTINDFEDFLGLFEKHQVRYLIIGGLAFIYHAKPRYTKDMDLWVDFESQNIARANRALAEFGSTTLLSVDRNDEVLQLGFAPDRLDLFLRIAGVDFDTVWKTRIRDHYGAVETNWIDIDNLLAIKSNIDSPRHQEDARILAEVKRRRGR